MNDRSHELLSGRTRPGWLGLAAGFSAACLCIVAAYFFVSSTPWRFGIFWAGLVVLTISCAWSLWFRPFSTAAHIGILTAAGIISYLPKLFRSYDYPANSDELLHLGQANLLESGIWFGHNSADPIVGHYPLYQMLVVGVHLTTQLSMWHSSLAVAGAGHVAQLLAVYLLVRHLSGSPPTGAIGAILWLAGPGVLFWLSEASYETIGLPLAFLTIYSVLRASETASRRKWTSAALIGMMATTSAQPVSSLFLAGFLVILAVVQADLHVKDALGDRRRWKSFRLPAFALASLAINLVWTAIADLGLTLSYLLPKWSTVEASLIAIAHAGSPRDPFQRSGLPVYERYAGYAALALTATAVAAALFVHLWGRPRPDLSTRERTAIRASFCFAALYVLSMPFALSAELAIWVHRSQELEWVGVCVVLALLLSWILGRTGAHGLLLRNLSAVCAVAFAVELLVGNTATTATADSRFAQPYQLGRGAGMATPDQLAAAQWMAEHHPGARFAADPDTAYIQWAYGGGTWVSDRYPAFELTFGYPIEGPAEASVRRFNVQFLVIDMLMYQEASVGHIYSSSEPNTYLGRPVPYAAYQRLLAVPWVTLVYANTQMSILELSPRQLFGVEDHQKVPP